MNWLTGVVLQGFRLDAAPNLFQGLESIIVTSLRAQRYEIARINIAHLCEELPLDVGCGGVLNHAIHKRDALLIEPVRLLGMSHLVDDFCFDSEVAWNEVELIRDLGVRLDRGVYRCKRIGESPLCS